MAVGTLTKPGKAPAAIGTVDDDPLVQQQTKQRADLTTQLAALQADRARLITERDRLRKDEHSAEVSRLLGGGPPAAREDAPRLPAVERELAQIDARIPPLKDAIDQLGVQALATRQRVQGEIQQRARGATRDLISQQAGLLRQVEELNAQVLKLHTDAGLVAPATVPLFAFTIEGWREAARGLGAEV